MDKIRALIVDDEPLAREGIRLYLADEPDVDVVGEAEAGDDAVTAIRSIDPDLVFLDIQMPGRDGFGVLEAVGPQQMPPVIFVTAYDRFALRAFDAHAVDYLLKPFDAERFQRALDRARDQIRSERRTALNERLAALLAEVGTRPEFTERFAVRSGGKIFFVRVDDIDWIEAQGNYARLHAGERGHLVRETMAGLEARLDPARFVRIHRSTIVRIDAIREMEPLLHGEHVVVLRSGKRLIASRGCRDRLSRLLG